MGYGRGVRRALVAGATGALFATSLVTARAGATEACDNAQLPDAPTVRVLVVGDSLSHGFQGDWTWRYRLWQQQRARGVNVDFVGPWSGLSNLDYSDANGTSAIYADPCFEERQHYAHVGMAYSDVLLPYDGAPSVAARMVELFDPDVVLGFMGANDVINRHLTAEQVLANAETFVEQVRVGAPDTAIAMATVTSSSISAADPDRAVMEQYNVQLQAAVPTWSSEASPVGLVDVTQHWQGVPDTWDGLHANAIGEMHLAHDVADGLAGLGFLAAPAPGDFQDVPLGPRTPVTLAVQSHDQTKVQLGWVPPAGADRVILWSRDLSAGTAWSAVAVVPVATTAMTVTDLLAHHYEFRAQAARGTAVAEDLYSTSVSVDLTSPPVALGRVSAPLGDPRYHAVAVSWSLVDGASSYLVRWRRAGASSWHGRVVPGPTTLINNLTAGARYAFRVTAQRPGDSGPESLETVVVPRGTVNPAVPRPKLATLSGHRLRVVWSPAVDATRYQVLVRRGSRPWRTLGWRTGTRMASGALPAGHFRVRVRPWDSYVGGALSPVARIRLR